MAQGEDAMRAMVHKNAYILVTNIAGLQVGGNVHQLFTEHRSLCDEVLSDVLAVQKVLVGREFDMDSVREFLLRAVAADPRHGCRGRSAPVRLKRALAVARQAEIPVPALERISRL